MSPPPPSSSHRRNVVLPTMSKKKDRSWKMEGGRPKEKCHHGDKEKTTMRKSNSKGKGNCKDGSIGKQMKSKRKISESATKRQKGKNKPDDEKQPQRKKARISSYNGIHPPKRTMHVNASKIAPSQHSQPQVSMQQHLPPPLPPFEPKDSDPHIKPQPGQLISCLWTTEFLDKNQQAVKNKDKGTTQLPVYRTGVMRTRNGLARFYKGDQKPERPKQPFVNYSVTLTKKFFQEKKFRVRTDLVVGALCWDTYPKHHRHYRILEIDMDSGAVFVEYVNASQNKKPRREWMWPDALVGYPRQESNTTTTERENETTSLTLHEESSVVDSSNMDYGKEERNSKDSSMIVSNEKDSDASSIASSVNQTEASAETQLSRAVPVTPEKASQSHFEPSADDDYITPQPGQLITYLFHKIPAREYRTGVLCSKDGLIRFYNEKATEEEGRRGGDDANRSKTSSHQYYEKKFCLNRKLFREQMFRVRTDLVVGSLCYDRKRKIQCTLVDIDRANGAVLIETADKTTLWISPDTLQLEFDSIDLVCENRRKEEGKFASLLSSGDHKPVNEVQQVDFLGVYEGEETAYCWYIRGKLGIHVQEQVSDRIDAMATVEKKKITPFLLKGERVRYCRSSGRMLETGGLEKLRYCPQREELVPAVTEEEKQTCEEMARYAEIEHAKVKRQELSSTRGTRRPTRSTVLTFRPMQPVFVLNRGRAIVVKAPENGFTRVTYDAEPTDLEEEERSERLRLAGFEDEPYDLQDFFLSEETFLPKQQDSYRQGPAYLLEKWKKANGILYQEFVQSFEDKVNERNKIRRRALDFGAGPHECNSVDFTEDVGRRLDARYKELLKRLQDDFSRPRNETMMGIGDFQARIQEVQRLQIHPNMLLLCGGFAPEVVAYKRLRAAPLGIVIIQDTDLHAIGVAVAAHPDVEFAIVAQKDHKYPPGDVRILRRQNVIEDVAIRVGGIPMMSITSPCTSFSLAGKKEGFHHENGQLFHDCKTIFEGIKKFCGEEPFFLTENVPSTKDSDESYNEYLPERGAKCFVVCGSICSPSLRRRKFSTNRPPPICPEQPKPDEPPCLNGDLPHAQAASITDSSFESESSNDSTCRRMVHPKLKKVQCLMYSNQAARSIVWEQSNIHQPPTRAQLKPMEAERAMGFSKDEIGEHGVTAFTAQRAIEKRIREHNYERDGYLISLKGCHEEGPLDPVPDGRRLELLGNSQIVTLLEAFLWNERRRFPDVTKDG